MMTAMERLQKERAADRELVASVQKAMTLIREAHSQDQMRWEEEKARLDRQIKEVRECVCRIVRVCVCVCSLCVRVEECVPNCVCVCV